VKAALLEGHRFAIEEIPTPSPGPGEVLVRVGGAGVCHSDLDLLLDDEGHLPDPPVLGHENAGWIAKLGSGVRDLELGAPVLVYGGWGCGSCALCSQGRENLCDVSRWCGIGRPGGFAEYLLVPDRRHILIADGLEPRNIAPLADAALTPYSAARKVINLLEPGTTAVVIGIGGLGQFAVQILRHLTPATIIAVDTDAKKLEQSLTLGADHALNPSDVGFAVGTHGVVATAGAAAVLDFVGTDDTLALGVQLLAKAGAFVLIGLAGGRTPFSFRGLPAESMLTTSNWGTRNELLEVMDLYRSGAIHTRPETAPLEEINAVFEQLRRGAVRGRAVLVP
jgi:propanol-preferring alcohol dehydrogenase